MNCQSAVVAQSVGCVYVGCNYVLHSSGQLFSHKRKHERRFWEYSAPSKRPKLQVTSVATSAEAAACGSDAVADPSITTVTSVCGAQSGLTQSTLTSCGPPVNGRNALPGDCAGSTQSSVSKLSAVSQLATQSSSLNTEPVGPATAAAVADEISETKTPETVASTSVDSAHADLGLATENVDLSAARPSPAAITVHNDDEVPTVIRSLPVHHDLPPINVVDQSSDMPAQLDDAKLENLERKEYVDLEDLAKMTKLKQRADEKRTAPESTHVMASCGINTKPLTPDLTLRNSRATATSAPALSVMRSKSIITTKCPRRGGEQKERDDSWQKYIKRSAAVLLREY